VGYLTLENLAECDVDEATRWQRLEHAVSEVYARTGTDRLKHGSSEEQPNWVHQSVSHGSYNDRLVAVVNANKLKAKTERNHCLVDKVSNEDGPNLKYTDTICLQPCAVFYVPSNTV